MPDAKIAGHAYAELIGDQLDQERARKASIEARGLSVTTTEFGSRWVIKEDDGARWTIPPGRGDKVAFAGDPELLESLDVAPSGPDFLQIVLVGVPEIADHAGVQNDSVRKWRQRHEDFPRQLAELNVDPVWSLQAFSVGWARMPPRGTKATV